MYIQRVIDMRWEGLDGGGTHQDKLLFGLPFFRKLKFMLEFIFTVFRVIESFMDSTVEEQRLRTKKVNAKKVNTAKTQAKTYRHNLVTSFTCMRPCLQFIGK
jgi:hypothetical protein